MADAKEPADRRHDPLAFAAEMIERAERESTESGDEETGAAESAEPVEVDESVESAGEPAAVDKPPSAEEPAEGPLADATAALEDVAQDAGSEISDDEVDEEAPDAGSRRRGARTRRQSAVEKRRRDR